MKPGERFQLMQGAGATVYEQYEHLREVFPDPRCVGFWCWLNTHGWRESDSIREITPPVPPREVFRFSNTSDEWGYVLTASSTYKAINDLLAGQNLTVSELGSILDFGCGPGRGLRLFYAHADEVELHGTDVDAQAIVWCQENIEFATFHRNSEEPSLDFASDSFGLVFSISVFSHFSRAIAMSWLVEIERILRPGGIAALSIHGAHAIERICREEPIFQMMEVSRHDFEKAKNEFETEGFGFIRQPGGHLDRGLYGVSFVSETHVRECWSEVFEVLEIRRGAIDNWQDIVVLRKRL